MNLTTRRTLGTPSGGENRWFSFNSQILHPFLCTLGYGIKKDEIHYEFRLFYLLLNDDSKKSALIYAIEESCRKTEVGIAEIPGGIFFLVLFFDAKEKEHSSFYQSLNFATNFCMGYPIEENRVSYSVIIFPSGYSLCRSKVKSNHSIPYSLVSRSEKRNKRTLSVLKWSSPPFTSTVSYFFKNSL